MTKHNVRKENYVWNLSRCDCEIDKYLKINTYIKILIDLVIICDEITDMPEIVLKSYNDRKQHIKCVIIIFYTLYY